MSIEALSVVLHHSRARLSAKLVLIGIANHYHPDDERGAWPSQETLAKYANITDRGVRKAIEQLVELGELRVESHGGPGKDNYKPNRYFILLDCPPDCDGSMNHKPRQPGEIATGTFEQSNRNSLTEQPEHQFRLTVIEPERTIKQPKGRLSRLPEDWYPEQRLLDMFDTKWPNLNRDFEIEQFTNYWHAEGKTKADWSRAFQVWCNRSQERAAKSVNRGQTRREAAEQRALENARMMKQLRAERGLE